MNMTQFIYTVTKNVIRLAQAEELFRASNLHGVL
jgi:hypothetical protein